MFDLNAAIDDWRGRMTGRPDLQVGDIDELEDHLREIVAELTAKGLAEQEAFLIAVHRLGDPDLLAGEFAAADPGLRRKLRLRWILVGGLAVLALMAFAELVGMMSLGRMELMHVRGPMLGWSWGILQVVVLALGVLFIWKVTTRDRAARSIFSHAVWIVGLLLMIIAAGWLLGRPGAAAISMIPRTLPGDMIPPSLVPLLSAWTRIFLVALPALLLIGLLGLLDRGFRPRR
ncbi:MAG: permease prefix domain 1-containing protein [Candidatus Krumholzibacteriia bacterium]